jgi:predicted DNA-binding transcriptional regulator AlpA
MAARRFLLEEGLTLLGVDDLVQILNLPGRRALYNRISRGTVPPPVRVGASLRWVPAQVSRWLEAHQDAEAGK